MKPNDVDIYFTDQLLTYLATYFGSAVDRVFLLQNGSEIDITEDIITNNIITSEIESRINKSVNWSTEVTENQIEITAKIKPAKNGWKSKGAVFAGLIPNTLRGTSTDLAPPLIEEEVLFVKENPSKKIAKSVFSHVFNSSTKYRMHFYQGNLPLTTKSYDGFDYTFFGSSADFLNNTISDSFCFYEGTSTAGSNGTHTGLLIYPGCSSPDNVSYSIGEDIVLNGSNCSLTAFMYQTSTGLMLGTFSELLVKVSSASYINGFFITNESIVTKKDIGEGIIEEQPLILFGCKINGDSGMRFYHKTQNKIEGQEHYTIMKTPKINLKMDVVII